MRGLLAVECMYHQIVAGNKGQTRRSGGLDAINEKPHQWKIVHTSLASLTKSNKMYVTFQSELHADDIIMVIR